MTLGYGAVTDESMYYASARLPILDESMHQHTFNATLSALPHPLARWAQEIQAARWIHVACFPRPRRHATGTPKFVRQAIQPGPEAMHEVRDSLRGYVM